MRTTFMTGLFCAALAASQAGCVVASDDAYTPLPDPGTLTVDYTIEGSTDPALCDYYEVSDVELVVYTARGDYVAREYQPCADFTVSRNLYAGDYTADVTLVDTLNRARSVTKPLDDLRVLSGAELVITLDFPPDSML